MKESTTSEGNGSRAPEALEALARGYVPIPIRTKGKNPHLSNWTHQAYEDMSQAQIETAFDTWAAEGAENIGLVLGEPSNGLIDVDLDHPWAVGLAAYCLPTTPMMSGRLKSPRSHYWYQVTDKRDDDGTIAVPGNRRFKLPDGSMLVELRSTGSQTLIPHSTHPDGDKYEWVDEPWGGTAGPTRITAAKLELQVTLLALASVLRDQWPKKGTRHEAYLALAGGLLRQGDGVSAYWERNLPILIEGLVMATHDADGPRARIDATMKSTLESLREGKPTTGLPRLGEFIGTDHAELVRRLASRCVELGTGKKQPTVAADGSFQLSLDEVAQGMTERASLLPPEQRNPMSDEERPNSWYSVDLDPYLSGEVVFPEPQVLRRDDGKGLMYEGRVNMLYGPSESGKSWVSLVACQQEMALGNRAIYVDLEDEPSGTLMRLRALGTGIDDIRHQFHYVHPEGPLAAMQRSRYGLAETDIGRTASGWFKKLIAEVSPSLIVVDGMTSLYGLHGLDTNDATSTDVISTWLKSLTGGNKVTVLVIDHTGKGAKKGSSPIGAHHKIAMVQGSALMVNSITQPRRGAIGRIEVSVHKDRPGAVRALSTANTNPVVAHVTIDSTQEGITRLTIETPDPDEVPIGPSDEAMAAAVEKAEREQVAREKAEQEAIRQAFLTAHLILCFDGEADLLLTRVDLDARLSERYGIEPTHGRETLNALNDSPDIAKEGQGRGTLFRLKS